MSPRIAAGPASDTALTPARAHVPACLLQRKCACGGHAGVAGECARCAGKRLSRRRAGAAPDRTLVPDIVYDVLRMPGRPLDDETGAAMGRRFGHDFSDVRIHADARAAISADAVSALAYTVGSHVVFAAGRYAPTTGEGRRLLAHELTHVMQQDQRRGAAPVSLRLDTGHDAAEHEALSAETGAAPCTAADGAGLLQRKIKEDKSAAGGCGGTWSCTSGIPCDLPDNPYYGPLQPSTWWKLTVMVDIDVPTAAEVDEETVGHTFVKFEESNGTVYTYGFYPSPADPPSLFKTVVNGCMVHPDTKHEPCVDYPEAFSLTEAEYAQALSTAQLFCRGTPKYDLQKYNCTSFADTIARDAGKSLPAVKGTIGSGMMSAEADNPNTLYENLKARDAAAKSGGSP